MNRIPVTGRLAMLWDAGTWGFYPDEYAAWRHGHHSETPTMTWPEVGTVHVHPFGPDGHTPSKQCPCGPSVERWTVEGRQHVRVVHHQLEEVARPRAEDVLPGPRATVDVERP